MSFGAGCNILTGPSNSGKSYIVECIDFILGGDTIPGEDIEESRGYDTAFLELKARWAPNLVASGGPGHLE